MHTHEEIAFAAYYIWEKNPDSDADANWYDAEAQLMANVPDSELLSDLRLINTGAQPNIVR